MSLHRLTNALLVVFILSSMFVAQLLDGPSDTDAATDQAQNLQDARKDAHAELRITKARKSAGEVL